MRKLIMFATALLALAIPSIASADVQRYQSQTATFTATTPYGQVGQWQHVWTRKYTVTLNPCSADDSGSFVGTGKVYRDNGDFFADETISGKFAGNTVSFTAGYANVPSESDFAYTLTNATTDGNTTTTPSATFPSIPFNMDTKVTKPVITSTSYKNHGDYVKSQGGGDDAAHSCIGMPIVSGK